jgi:beta-lactamase class A
MLVLGALSLTQAGLVQTTTCGSSLETAAPREALPGVVTGRVGFFAAEFRNGVMVASRAVAVGDPAGVFPTASMFKTLVAHAAFRAVDEGRFRLDQKFLTTDANRSIEAYPKGSNTLLELVRRAIRNSDNTASDILHLAVGPERLARRVKTLSSCTDVLLTTKAWWAAQSGLSSSVLGADVFSGARAYASQPFEARLKIAARLNDAARRVTGRAVERALETYFDSALYAPELELWLQNTTTPRAFAELLAKVLPAGDLKPSTRQRFREIMTTGCCIAKPSPLRSRYRAAKAGSGWRVLTLSGYAELADGRAVAYAYMNDRSDTRDAEDMERQIRAVNAWIDRVVNGIVRQR